MRKFFLLVSLLGVTHGWAECRTVDNLRIDRADQLASLGSLCEVRGSLGIFLNTDREVSLPLLRRARLINIDSRGIRSLSLPALEQAERLYVQSPDLETVHFPKLQSVGTLYLGARDLREVHLPKLREVGDLYVQNNPELETLLSPELVAVRGLTMAQNPKLSPESVAQLTRVGVAVTPEQRAEHLARQREMREAQARALASQRTTIAPTGHPTFFGTIGNASYPRAPYYRYGYRYDYRYGYYPYRRYTPPYPFFPYRYYPW